MSNNLFRKGLVAAAIAGLFSAAVVGTPAFADAGTQINIIPAAGTSYSTFVDQNFELATSYNSGYAPNAYTQLSYKLEYANSASVSLDARSAITTGTASTPVAFTNGVAYVASAGPSTAITQNFLDLKLAGATSTTASQSVKVTAFVDANNNGTLDAGEWTAVATVNFKKYSEVTATPVLTAPFQGDSGVAAKVSFDGLNNEQLTLNSVTADVRKDGAQITAATAAWNSSTDHSGFKLSNSVAITAGSIYAVQAYYNGVAVGTQVSATSGTRTVATFTNSVVADANATGTSVRTDKPFVVKSVLKDGTSATAPVAGAAVTATITTSASLAALTSAATEKQLTVAGTTYTANANLPGGSNTVAVALVSDANGVVTLPISTNNFAAGDTITVSFASQNLTNATNLVVTETAADYTAYTNGGFAQTVDGTAASFPVKVYDQFGQALADGYYAVATFAGSSQTTAATAASSTYAAITGGAATLSILDNGTGAGTNTYTLTVQKRNADGSYAGNLGTHTTSTLTVAVNATAVPAAGTVTVGGSFTQDSTSKVYYIGTATSQTAQALNLNTLAAVDTRFSATAAPTVGTGVVVGGNVKTAATASAAAANIQGQSVTVAAQGLEFLSTVDGRAVWSLDSATVATDSSGNYSVTVYSNTSGVQTVTVTAGAATATAKIKFAAAAANTGSSLVITAPATVLPGQNVAFTATLTDKYGNVVATGTTSSSTAPSFSFSGTGVGNIGAAVYTTAADGTATLTASTGSADAGTITLTAVYSTDGTAANTTTVTKSVKVAAPAAAALAAKAAASAAQTGSAIAVTATATDAAGAPVAGVVVNFANAGTGYLSAASATTDANGLATVQLIGNVAGANAVTATAGAATATANVKFGNSDATLSNVGKRVTAAWTYAGGKKVIVSVNGKKVEALIASDDSADSYSFNAKKGTNKISVSIAGVVVDTLTVKVKK